MSLIGISSVKNFGTSIVVIIVLAISLAFVANAFQTESPKPAAPSADVAAKYPDHIDVIAKILSIDPIKGDVTARLEFVPQGKFDKEDDGTLSRTVKFDTISSNGKQEITFEKGKRMSPTEVVINMYDAEVTDYPFDKHKGNLIFWFTDKPDKNKSADKPKPTVENAEGESKPAPADEEDTEIDIPFALDFKPTMSGFNIESAKSKDSDDIYVNYEMTIARAGMVKLFAVFVMLLMWGAALMVLGLVFTVAILGRKPEIAMFSFIATLIFAFVTVRNSLPGVPPVGTFIDNYAFFWVEGILALSLLIVLATWLIRPAGK